MKKSILSLLLCLVGIAGTQTIQAESQIYATLVEGQFTLYYDDEQATRPDVLTEWTETDGAQYLSEAVQDAVTSIVLDESMQAARPTTTMVWFFNFKNAMQITGLHYLNTSEVTDMSYMFRGCASLTSLDPSGFDTQNVTTMRQMFMCCASLTTLDVSGFDTQNVTLMDGMFAGCASVTTLDVSGFDTRKVEYMHDMFTLCSSLTTIYCDDDWSQINTETVSSDMFAGCEELVGGNGTAYDEEYTDITYARPDEDGQPGYFTKKNSTAICNVAADKVSSTKLIRNGILIIRRGDKEYNARGQRVL